MAGWRKDYSTVVKLGTYLVTYLFLVIGQGGRSWLASWQRPVIAGCCRLPGFSNNNVIGISAFKDPIRAKLPSGPAIPGSTGGTTLVLK